MIVQKTARLLVAASIILISVIGIAAADIVRTDLSKIEIQADHNSVAKGSDFNVVIELTPNPGWHAYWENPGDAGLKLSMDWTEQQGVEIDGLQFTTPHLIPFEEIVSYGYDGKVVVIAKARISDEFAQSNVTIGGSAFWLICSDALCVPQETEISFDLPIGEHVVDKRMSAVVEVAKADMPVPADWPSRFYTDGENFTVTSDIPAVYPVIESAYLFPQSEGMMENVYHQDLSFVDGKIIGRFKNAYGYEENEDFKFVLSFKTGEGREVSYALNAKQSLEPIIGSARTSDTPTETLQTRKSDLGLVSALLFAFLGGLILNLMPCVFPILSLKAMSVAKLSEKDPSEARLSGLFYTLGVVICFAIIGALVNGLSVGWGFHLQMPIVNFLLGLLMTLIGLNLLGVFEFSSSFAGIGQGMIGSSTDKNGTRRSTFLTGFLAVIVATPCTAPFMASALGFAFITGGISGFLIFIILGLGLAFPYLLLCYVPSFRNMLPKPGAWMETMKNILGFPMLGTAVWLFWIMGNQLGVSAMAVAISASLLLGVTLWSISKSGGIWKLLSALCAVSVIYSGYYISTLNIEQKAISSDEGGLNAVQFSSEKLKNEIDNNQAVFVYFTADWCVTCKLNERVALSQNSVHQALKDKNVIVMVGDWTNQNPDITKTLQGYGRIGVPLYLYFPEGRSINNPDILPQILTPSIVIEAL